LPEAGLHPLTGTAPDGSSRESHHVPQQQLYLTLVQSIEGVAAKLGGHKIADALVSFAESQAKPEGVGLSAILIHRKTHQSAKGAAVHGPALAPLVAQLLRDWEAETGEKLVRITKAESDDLEMKATDPDWVRFIRKIRGSSLDDFIASIQAQAAALKQAADRTSAEAAAVDAKAKAKAARTAAEQALAKATIAAIRPMLRTAFTSAYAAGISAVKAALSVSGIDGPRDQHSGIVTAVRGFATSSWQSLLDLVVDTK
jgi:hypothetical protein